MGDQATGSTADATTPTDSHTPALPDEVSRTIRTLRRHDLVVKVLSHGAPHLEDARA